MFFGQNLPSLTVSCKWFRMQADSLLQTSQQPTFYSKYGNKDFSTFFHLDLIQIWAAPSPQFPNPQFGANPANANPYGGPTAFAAAGPYPQPYGAYGPPQQFQPSKPMPPCDTKCTDTVGHFEKILGDNIHAIVHAALSAKICA
jgi:hypothetical protein